jgi:tetratricopeptide (TPR) repeat protein
MRQARSYAERVLLEVRELGDDELVALASLQLSRVLVLQGQFGPVEGLLTPIIAVLERAGRWLDWTYALGYLEVALAARGYCAAGVAQGERAVERARRAGEIKSYHGIMARHFLSVIYMYSYDLSRMLEENNQVVQEAQQIGNWLLVYWAYGFRSRTQGLSGQYEEAMQSMVRAQAASQRLGGHIMGQDILEAVTAELLLATGRTEEALAHVETTMKLAREEVGGILSEGIAERVRGQALAHLSRWEEAQKHLASSVRLLLSGESLLEAAHTRVIWGLLCRDRYDHASARSHFEQAFVQFEASGLIRGCETVQRYLTEMTQG